MIARAKREGFENGKKGRVDGTVIDANIHHPLDSSLLYDVVRVLARRPKQARRCWSDALSFSDHTKRAKRRMLDVVNARSMAHRVPVYRELVKITLQHRMARSSTGSYARSFARVHPGYPAAQ